MPMNEAFESDISVSTPQIIFLLESAISRLSTAPKWLNFPVLGNVISDKVRLSMQKRRKEQ